MTGLNAAISVRFSSSSAARKGRVVKVAVVVVKAAREESVAIRAAPPRGPMIHVVHPPTHRHPNRKAWCRLKPPNAVCGSG